MAVAGTHHATLPPPPPPLHAPGPVLRRHYLWLFGASLRASVFSAAGYGGCAATAAAAFRDWEEHIEALLCLASAPPTSNVSPVPLGAPPALSDDDARALTLFPLRCVGADGVAAAAAAAASLPARARARELLAVYAAALGDVDRRSRAEGAAAAADSLTASLPLLRRPRADVAVTFSCGGAGGLGWPPAVTSGDRFTMVVARAGA